MMQLLPPDQLGNQVFFTPISYNSSQHYTRCEPLNKTVAKNRDKADFQSFCHNILDMT